MSMTLTPAGGAGTGATVDHKGTDEFGSFVLTTGTGAAGGAMLNYSLSGVFLNEFAARLVPLNAAAMGLSNVQWIQGNGIFFSGTVTDNTDYEFAYKLN